MIKVDVLLVLSAAVKIDFESTIFYTSIYILFKIDVSILYATLLWIKFVLSKLSKQLTLTIPSWRDMTVFYVKFY